MKPNTMKPNTVKTYPTRRWWQIWKPNGSITVQPENGYTLVYWKYRLGLFPELIWEVLDDGTLSVFYDDYGAHPIGVGLTPKSVEDEARVKLYWAMEIVRRYENK